MSAFDPKRTLAACFCCDAHAQCEEAEPGTLVPTISFYQRRTAQRRSPVMHLIRDLLLCLASLLATSALAPAADNTRGAVEQSSGSIVPQNPSLPKLHLNDAQRERVRQTLMTKDTEVEFRLKTTQSAKDFTPKIGATFRKASSLMAFRRN